MGPEPRSGQRGWAVAAFGLCLQIDDELALEGLGALVRPDKDVVAVCHAKGTLGSLWRTDRASRSREVRGPAGELRLSVDHDPLLGYLLDAPGLGQAFLRADGAEVFCEPGPVRHEWEALLVGQILPLIATVRGLEVLHAAGVVVNGQAHLIAAAQGVGKTTLAAHLVHAGADLLSDDAVAIDGGLVAHPGSTVLKLRPDAALSLALRLGADLPLPGARQKQRVLIDAPRRPARVATLLLLEPGPAAAIEELTTPSPFLLLSTTYNLSVRTPERLKRHLEMCAAMAECVSVFRVTRDQSSDTAAFAAEIYSHLNSQAA